MPAAMYCRPPVLAPLIVATRTMEPRLPSIGIAFIRTPLAPSACSICGGGCSCSWPVGSSGASRRPPRSVLGVRVWEPASDSDGLMAPPPCAGPRGTTGGGLSVVVTALPFARVTEVPVGSMIGLPPHGAYVLPTRGVGLLGVSVQLVCEAHRDLSWGGHSLRNRAGLVRTRAEVRMDGVRRLEGARAGGT